MRLRRNNSLVSFIISQSHVKWEVFFNLVFTRQGWERTYLTLTDKQRSVFPSSQALMKALYLSTFEIAKKWTMPIRNWGKVRGELEIMFPDRMLI